MINIRENLDLQLAWDYKRVKIFYVSMKRQLPRPSSLGNTHTTNVLKVCIFKFLPVSPKIWLQKSTFSDGF